MGLRLSAFQSFGAKLTLLVTLTSGLTVVLVCVVLVVLDYIDTRQERINFVATQASIIAISESAAFIADPKSGAGAWRR